MPISPYSLALTPIRLFLCVIEFDTTTTPSFCVASPADISLVDKCAQTMSSDGQPFGAMICDSLQMVNP